MKILALMATPLLLGGCALAGPGEPGAVDRVAGVETASWRPVDAATGGIADIPGLEQLARDFPDSTSVRLRLLSAHLGADNHAEVAAATAWLLDRGYRFSPGGQAALGEFLAGHDPALVERLGTKTDVVAHSEIAATIPAGARLIESVARLPDGRWIAGSIVDRTAYVTRTADPASGWEKLDLPGAGSLSGIVVDETRGRVWLASGAYDPTPDARSAYRGLIGLAYADRFAATHIPGPDAAVPSDLAMAVDGTFYASDPIGGAIYSGKTGDAVLDTLVPGGNLRSPQGLVLLDKGRKLLVSDYRYGLALIDLRSRAMTRVSTDLPLALDGIDGMWAWGDEIVAVQNGISPMRIVAFTIDRSGTRVVASRIVEMGHPDWGEPLGGSVVGDDFYYVANGQWSRFGEGGVATTDAPPLATQIRRVSLQR